MKVVCGDRPGGLAHARRAVGIAMRERLRDEMMYALRRHAVALIAVGRLATAEGQELQARVAGTSRSVNDPGSYVQLLLDLAEWHTNTGSLEPAAEALAEARSVAEPMDCPVVGCTERMTHAALALARGDAHGARSAIGAPSVLPRLRIRHASIEGNSLLELGMLGRAKGVAERCPLDAAPGSTPVDLTLFHARLRSRTGHGDGALKLLEDAAAATRETDPVAWLRIALEQVRLGRRSGVPFPDLANQARELALALELPGLAHEFVPFQDG